MREVLEKLLQRSELSGEEIAGLFDSMMKGTLPAAAAGAALALLAAKGPTPGELAAAARVMRTHALCFEAGLPDVLDTCGTGGDRHHTFNISTAAAIVAAGAGAKVVKHGNRSSSSRSGSADVLEALGVNLDVPKERLPGILAETGLCFCFARSHHPAMANIAEVRKALGIPTVFNLLGPLTNPGGAKRQLLGVYRSELLYLMAETLQQLGSTHAWVVHGTDGLDELSTMGSTSVVEVKGNRLERNLIDAREYGIPRGNLKEMQVSSPGESAEMIRGVLAGKKGAARDIVVLNAGAALVVAGETPELKEGIRRAQDAVDTGAAGKALERLVGATKK